VWRYLGIVADDGDVSRLSTSVNYQVSQESAKGVAHLLIYLEYRRSLGLCCYMSPWRVNKFKVQSFGNDACRLIVAQCSAAAGLIDCGGTASFQLLPASGFVDIRGKHHVGLL
jgi:hypothetical protein